MFSYIVGYWKSNYINMIQEMYQVNCHINIDGREEYYMSRAYNGGYVGRETDTVYSDGVSYTDYGVY